MLKTTLKFENHGARELHYIGYGVNFKVPGNTVGDDGISVNVPKGCASAIAAAVQAKRPSMVITPVTTFDDGVEPEYMPFVKNNFEGDGAPAVSNDETEYYGVGSVWIDTTSTPHEVYRCADASEGAAVWLNSTLEASEVATLLASYAPLASPSFTGTVSAENITPTELCLPEKAPVNAAAATGTLTSDGTKPLDTTSAFGILTALGAPNNGEIVKIGDTVYTFKTALSDPAAAYEVLIDAPLPNLVLAINGGAGEGVNYSAGTVAHPDVTAGEVSEGATTISAKVPGAAGNLIEKSTTATNFDWDGTGAYFTGGRDVETIAIDGKTYTWKEVLTPAEGEVLIGASAESALLNLKNAINHEGNPGTDYSCEEAHPTVKATASTATTLTIEARVKGAAGNSVATTETETGDEAHVSWGADHLALGVDGTVGKANEVCCDGTYLYQCIAANTINDANWRRMALGSVY